MKRELRNEHPMLLELEDRGGRGCLVGEISWGGRKRYRFAVSPSKRGPERRFLKSFVEREMNQVGKSENREVYRTSFDLLNVFSWLWKKPMAAKIYYEDGKERLLRHMKTLKGVLTDPIPSKEKVKGLLNRNSPLRSQYEKLEEELNGGIPEDGASKEVYARVAGANPEFKTYRKKAEEELERVNEAIRSLENTISEIEYY